MTPDTTYSILPTDRLGIRRRTSGGLLLVLLLLDAVDVPEPPLAVALAEPAGPVTEADAVTLTPDEVTAATEVDDPGETDCAAAMDRRDHRAKRREKNDCILAVILRTAIRICSGFGKGKNECESPRWTERASREASEVGLGEVGAGEEREPQRGVVSRREYKVHRIGGTRWGTARWTSIQRESLLYA